MKKVTTSSLQMQILFVSAREKIKMNHVTSSPVCRRRCIDIWVSGSLPLPYTCQWSLCGGTAGSRCRGVQRHQGGAQCCEVNRPPSKYDNRPDDHLGSVYNTESEPRWTYLILALYVYKHMLYVFSSSPQWYTNTYRHIQTRLGSVVVVGSTAPGGGKL